LDLSTIGRTQKTHRDLVAWFSSPRTAVRTASRLLETVPSARVAIRRTQDHGAEGPIVALTARIPWLWSAMVTRQLDGLGVAVLWDPTSIDGDAETRSAA
jgi:hypothetical protein